jgi:hypothetical protein
MGGWENRGDGGNRRMFSFFLFYFLICDVMASGCMCFGLKIVLCLGLELCRKLDGLVWFGLGRLGEGFMVRGF